jgi:hypothetical protein
MKGYPKSIVNCNDLIHITNKKFATTTFCANSNNNSIMDFVIPQLVMSLQCFLGVSLTLSTQKSPFKLSKLMIAWPLDNK